MRMPIAAEHLGHLANEWLRFVHPLIGKVCKALVVDLDNTLWGGVIGEDGMEGIQVGPEYPGAAYQALQRAILDLYDRGIVWQCVARTIWRMPLEALENHPGMLLRPITSQLSVLTGMTRRRIFARLQCEPNIGIDALAFPR